MLHLASGFCTLRRFRSPTAALPSNRVPHGNQRRLSLARSFLRFALALVAFVLAAGPATLQAQNYSITTLAGSVGSTGSADGIGSAARFRQPNGVAVDSAGNVYVADTENHTIRKITPAGLVSTLAGTAGSEGSADGIGSAARFKYPAGVAVDSAGNIYVADTENNTIRKITSGGLVTTFAGSAGTSGSANGSGAAARFSGPVDVTVDSAGNVYVADNYSHIIRKITSLGAVTTLAGSAERSGSAYGTGAAARFFNPNSVAVDSAGNVFVADSGNDIIRKIAISGLVTTVAGVAGKSGCALITMSSAIIRDDRGGSRR